MKYPLEEELLLKRFLLGELSQSEQSEIEERLFEDPQYFSQFRAAEDELIDEYLYGDLNPEEKEQFEKYFVTTPERRESLRVAKALQQYIVKNGPSVAPELADEVEVPAPLPAKRSIFDILGLSGPALRFSMAAAMILIVGVAVWLVLRTGQKPSDTIAEVTNVQPSPPQINQGETNANQNNGVQPQEGNRNENTRREVPKPRPPQQPSARYSFLILPLRQVRGEGGVNKIQLPADAGTVNLKVPLIEEGDYTQYRIALQTDSQKTVKSWSNLKSTNEQTRQTISIDVPAKSLSQQKYRLVLSGVSNTGNLEIISTFRFQVIK